MAFYRGRVGADLDQPAFGKEEEWDPVANNGNPYFQMDPAIGWDPYRLPTYDLQELITDYGITNESYSQSYPVDYVETNDDFSGVDKSFGTTDPSYYSLNAAPSGYTYDSTTPITFTVTSPYQLQNPTYTTTRDVGSERTWSVTSNSHNVTQIELVGQPGGTVSSAAIGGETRIINDYTLAYKETRTGWITANGSATFFYFTDSMSSYMSDHQDDEYGSALYLNQAVSPKCVGINITVYNALTNQVMSKITTMPSTRSADSGFVWNTSEQAVWGGTALIGVKNTNGQPFMNGTQIKFEFYMHTYKDRNANLDITNLFNISYTEGTATALPRVNLSKKANPGRYKGAPMGSDLDGTVVWPYAVYTFNNNLSGHNPKAFTNISGYSWINDAYAYKAAQYPVKTVNVVVRQANGNVSPVGYNITRPIQDSIFGYYNGLTSATSSVSSAVQINFTSGQLSPGMTVDLEVTYDKFANTGANVDWTSYYNAYINDVDTSQPKLRVLGNGSNPIAPVNAGVPHGVNINCNFYSTKSSILSLDGLSTLASNPSLHDPVNFGYSLGNTVPTYGCYQLDVTVKNASNQNVTSQCTVNRPPLDIYGYYDVAQGVFVTKSDGSGLPYNWTVEIEEHYNTYRDLGLNQDITADYNWSEEYINPSNPALGVFLKVEKIGASVGPPNNTYMRTRYYWDLDPGGLPLIVLLNQNFYRR